MSTWIKEKSTKAWGQAFFENVLKCGNIPKHIAIIMDGNRRFAVKKKYERCVGHLLGFNKVSETLEWCSGLGVREVTLYAFSLENFKRSKEEVDCLMELAKNKFSALLDEKDLVMSHSLCVRIIGNLSYLPQDLQVILAQVVDFTKHNKKVFLNVCCAYTSQEEMTQAMRKMEGGVGRGSIVPSDIDEKLFEKSLYTSECSEPDILIRTSGEVRLSDFLLWQTSYSMLWFTSVLWPEFSRWHLYSVILLYQLNHTQLMRVREERTTRRKKQRHETDCRMTRQLLNQFSHSVLVKEHLDSTHLDQLIMKINIEDDEEVLLRFNTIQKYKSSNFTPTTTNDFTATASPIESSAIISSFESTTPTKATKPTTATTPTTPTKVTTAILPTDNDYTEEVFERLLDAVVASRERRCGGFVQSLRDDYYSHITSILKLNGIKQENGYKNGYNKNASKSQSRAVIEESQLNLDEPLIDSHPYYSKHDEGADRTLVHKVIS